MCIRDSATTGGLYTQVGELYGFPIKVVSERILKEGLELSLIHIWQPAQQGGIARLGELHQFLYEVLLFRRGRYMVPVSYTHLLLSCLYLYLQRPVSELHYHIPVSYTHLQLFRLFVGLISECTS